MISLADVARFALTSFVALLVVIDPFAVIPVFVGLTSDRNNTERRLIGRRAVLIGFGVALFFLVAGRFLISKLGVSLDAFTISGGILLFLTALPMLFGQRGGLMSVSGKEEAGDSDDISVFPLAIPLISGPGTLTTVLVLSAAANADWRKIITLVLSLAAVFVLTGLVLEHGSRLIVKIGGSGIHVITRVLGIVLAAIAAQFVLNGVGGFLQSMHVHSAAPLTLLH
jgi:multiple antibiotic resistance protein